MEAKLTEVLGRCKALWSKIHQQGRFAPDVLRSLDALALLALVQTMASLRVAHYLLTEGQEQDARSMLCSSSDPSPREDAQQLKRLTAESGDGTVGAEANRLADELLEFYERLA